MNVVLLERSEFQLLGNSKMFALFGFPSRWESQNDMFQLKCLWSLIGLFDPKTLWEWKRLLPKTSKIQIITFIVKVLKKIYKHFWFFWKIEFFAFFWGNIEKIRFVWVTSLNFCISEQRGLINPVGRTKCAWCHLFDMTENFGRIKREKNLYTLIIFPKKDIWNYERISRVIPWMGGTLIFAIFAYILFHCCK